MMMIDLAELMDQIDLAELMDQNEMMGAQLAALIQRNGGPISFEKAELDAMLVADVVLNSDIEGTTVTIRLMTAEEAEKIAKRHAAKGKH